jgi:hypothetical protein
MMRAASADRLGSEFDNFLFAPIAEESNGMLLRVVSVLARLDVDPWEEASKLARLPGEAATRKLAALIAALPDGPSARQDPGTIAARLITLLPRPARAAMPAQQTWPQMPSANKSRAVTSVILYAIFMLFLLCAQWLMANRDPPPAPAQKASAPVTMPSIPR